MKNDRKIAANGEITYYAGGKEYEESFSIDLENYMTLFSVNSEHEDLLNIIKKQNSILTELKNSIDNVSGIINFHNKNDENV